MKRLIIGFFVVLIGLSLCTGYYALTFSPDETSTFTTTLLCATIAVLSAITFALTTLQLRRSDSALRKLSSELATLNAEYLFSSKEKSSTLINMKNSLRSNLQEARSFVQKIAAGDLDVEWEGAGEADESNSDTLSASLERLRDQLRAAKEADERRSWTAEGLSAFAAVARNNQNDLSRLADEALRFLTRHLGAQQGSLFIAVDGVDPHLKLASCYAFERKKYIEKRIEIGGGLVGQAYLESSTVVLTDVPQNYVSITSGLGEATPRCLVIVPMKYNNTIAAVAEFASFKKFEEHEVHFLEKAGEIVASSIFITRTNERTAELLKESQVHSESLRAQEEELRQNLEELEATQEQSQRQMREMQILKEQLEREKYLFSALMDHLPDTIYFKDKQSKLIRVSNHMAKSFNMPISELIGKSDFDFQDFDHAKEAFDDEQTIMRTRKPKIDFVEKEVRADGTEHWISSTKMPLIDAHGAVVGTFGVSRNISYLKKLEKLLKEHGIPFETEMKGSEFR